MKETNGLHGPVAVNHLIRWSLLAVVWMIVAFSTSLANADVWFLGIANGGYHYTLNSLLSAYLATPKPPRTSRHSFAIAELGGSEILDEIYWLTYSRPSDVAIFYYVGHGSHETDYGGDELLGSALDKYDETIGVTGDQMPDDELAAALGRINDRAHVVAILDMCYAGGMVGGLDDLNSLPNVLVMMSSMEGQPSYGGSPYTQFSSKLIAGLGPTWPADLNHDRAITFGEWFTYAKNELAVRNLQTPVMFDAANIRSQVLTYLPGYVVPEPASGYLAIVALVAFVLHRRRRPVSGCRRWEGLA